MLNAVPTALEPIVRLTRDQVAAAATLGMREIRYLVNIYYDMQDNRLGANNQVKQLTKRDEPHATLAWVAAQNEALEGQIRRALKRWAEAQPIGEWLMSITGIGPVISAGLIAFTDVNVARTAAQLWRFAGADPTQRWERGEKRPWNAALKTLRWKAGQSFVKVSGHDDDIYGKIIMQRRDDEWRRNLRGDLAEQAAEKLRRYSIDKTTDAWLWYAGCVPVEVAKEFANGEYRGLSMEQRAKILREHKVPPGEATPMLPPGHIQARAERYGTKLFLSHFHEVYYYLTHGIRPVMPFALARMGHSTYIAPPNTWMFVDDWSAVPMEAVTTVQAEDVV